MKKTVNPAIFSRPEKAPTTQRALERMQWLYSRFHAESSFGSKTGCLAENDVEAHKQKIKEMHRFYFNGMGGALAHIYNMAEQYQDYHDADSGQEAMRMLEFVKGKYAEIPFDRLQYFRK